MTGPSGMSWFLTATFALCAVFAFLGVAFVVAPAASSLLFGIPATDEAIAYVRALGLRDIALSAYLIWLMRCDDRQGLRVVLLASLLIPTGDLVLVGAVQGWRALPSLALHAWSRPLPPCVRTALQNCAGARGLTSSEIDVWIIGLFSRALILRRRIEVA